MNSLLSKKAQLIGFQVQPICLVDRGTVCSCFKVHSCAGDDEVWEVGVLPGPNAEPDYFTQEDIRQFYSSTYSVHYNS